MKKIIIIIIVLLPALLVLFILNMRSQPGSTRPGASVTPAADDEKDTQFIEEKDLGFSIRLPNDFIIEKNGQYSRLFTKKTAREGVGPANFIYLSVVPKGKEVEEGTVYNYNQKDVQILRRMQTGEKKVLGGSFDPQMQTYFTYERIDGLMLGGYGAKAFVNTKPWEFPQGTIEYRYLVEFEEATYIIGGYVRNDNTSSPGSLSKTQMDEALSTLIITPQSVLSDEVKPLKEGEWKTFTSPQHKISFEYPGNWPQNPGSQNFPEGDIFSLIVIGQTQRTQTELYDGVSFAVMKPVTATGDIETWVKKQYDTSSVDPSRPNEYSKVIFGEVVYEKVLTCGLGCFTYYHTQQNGMIYGFVVNAVGPQAAYYESIVSRILSSVKYL